MSKPCTPPGAARLRSGERFTVRPGAMRTRTAFASSKSSARPALEDAPAVVRNGVSVRVGLTGANRNYDFAKFTGADLLANIRSADGHHICGRNRTRKSA